MKDLSRTEHEQLEREVDTAMAEAVSAFWRIGRALAAIRELGQYGPSFSDYVEARFGMKRSQAYRLIDAAMLVESLPPGVEINSERAARELGRVPSGARWEVLELVHGPVTGPAVKAAWKLLTARQIPLAPVRPSTVQDLAEHFAQLNAGNGWEFARLVATAVGRTGGKVSAAEFARMAGTTTDRILRLLNTWELAADEGHCQYAVTLTPADHRTAELPDWELWAEFHAAANARIDR